MRGGTFGLGPQGLLVHSNFAARIKFLRRLFAQSYVDYYLPQSWHNTNESAMGLSFR